jgi:diguanylate cyclase (GGDEF)-like protein
LDSQLSLVLIDIDNFKPAENTKGGQSANKVLNRVTRILNETVGNDGCVSRMATNGFFVIIPLSKVTDICLAVRKCIGRHDNLSFNQGIVKAPMDLS